MLKAWGFGTGDVTRSVTLTTLWSQFVNLAYPVIAVFLLTATGQSAAPVATAAFIGVAILGVAVAGLVLVLWSDGLARDIGDAAARACELGARQDPARPGALGRASFERFRGDAVDLLAPPLARPDRGDGGQQPRRLRDVPRVAARARRPGGRGEAVEAFAAWALVRLLGSVPITPGGIGIIELGLTGALVAFGGANAQVVAAVLVFRC